MNPGFAATVPVSYTDEEIWHVALAPDDIKLMNVDQLDDAFRLDIVDESTLVWKTGMIGWEPLGVIAGLDSDSTTSVWQPERCPPPPTYAKPIRPPTSMYAQPISRPLPPAPPRPYAKPVSVPNARQVDPFAAAPFVAPQLTTQQLVAPVARPRGRARFDSEVDFRRRPGGFRIGRWLLGTLVLVGLVLFAYRANLLQKGARQLGIEGKYLAAEQSLHARIEAKAPPAVRNALTQLGFMPKPAALFTQVAAPPPAVSAPAPAVPTPQVAANVAPPQADNGVKAVSLESLPVIDDRAAAENAKPATATESQSAAQTTPSRSVRSVKSVDDDAAPTKPIKPVRQTKRAEPKSEVANAKEEAPVKEAPAKRPPPAAGAKDNPLNAAIRSIIQKDNSK